MSSLRGRTIFDRISREGKKFGKNFLQLRILPNSFQSNRLGIVIPVKAVRKAVDRNRIRRLVKAAYGSLSDSLAQGYDIVIMVRREPSVDHMHFVRDELEQLFRQSGLI